MVETTKKGEAIRQYILDNVGKHPENITARTSAQFGISRQAVHKHLRRLIEQKTLRAHGATRSRRYTLHPLADWEKTYALNALDEHAVWDADISGFMPGLSSHADSIWHYGFTEMLNNAISHSGGDAVFIRVFKTAATTRIHIRDNGEGIFNKIRRAEGLADERHATLELAKGKFTTDPDNHSGEGIFFSSRAFSHFVILSDDIFFSHQPEPDEDWIRMTESVRSGTGVFMELPNRTRRKLKTIFDRFAPEDEYAFNQTIIPVRLARYGDGRLVSRSQAKRLLSGLDKFESVTFDFKHVATIGQAFADEIFRVFQAHHPRMELTHVNAGRAVTQMITRALAHRRAQ
ncbi:MAG: STAS-like domain-containing protein [bacterium]